VSLQAVPRLEDLLADPARVQDLPPQVAVGLLPRVIGLQTALLARALGTPAGGNGAKAPEESDRLLTVKEAAEKLGLSEDYLYRHAKSLPFTVRVGPRQLRFSVRGIQRFIHQRQGR
jgi:excisionase family DNA binding protein